MNPWVMADLYPEPCLVQEASSFLMINNVLSEIFGILLVFITTNPVVNAALVGKEPDGKGIAQDRAWPWQDVGYRPAG